MPVSLPQLDVCADVRNFDGFDFAQAAGQYVSDDRLKRAVAKATIHKCVQVAARQPELPDPEGLRFLAGRIKQHTLDHLDYYLDQLKASVERNGGHVHFAADAVEARRIILDIATRARCTRVIKSKSMVSEEAEIATLLQRSGMDVVETDLGEFIVQIDNDRPSHIVAPVIHKDTAQIATLFEKYFQTPYTDDPRALCEQARIHLRNKFRKSDLGMTGANFLVAETGHACVVENEGNARQSVTTPRILVTLTGLEKVVPRLSDLAVMLKLLARNSTGQSMTVYTSIFGGPRAAGEKDGPEEWHLVLLDNGRSRILANPETREILRCIRCGACLNVCPVFRKVGGHPYGFVYSGPIGSLVSPLLAGLETFKDLPQASTLCGACATACPVKINIPQQLVNLRREIVAQKFMPWRQRFAYRVWARLMKNPLLYKLTTVLQKWKLRSRADSAGYIKQAPFPASSWTQIRDMPAPAPRTFHQLWKDRKK